MDRHRSREQEAGDVTRVGTTSLGKDGLTVGRVGLGAMVLSGTYGVPDLKASGRAFDRALELGITLVDTADLYGDGVNESFIGRLLAGRRNRVVLASKFGLERSADGLRINGRPDRAAASLDRSLERLGVDHVDLYYLHRVDPEVPVSETVGAMAELVRAGKATHLGLCEVTAEQLEQADAVHPITAVQSEWSLCERRIEEAVLGVARRLGAGIVPHSPLGRGFLAGAFGRDVQFAAGDDRRSDTRLSAENLEHNLALLDRMSQLAARLGVRVGQLALAWLMAQGDDVVPIPGMERIEFVDSAVAATELVLAAEDLTALDEIFPPNAVHGARARPR